MKKQNSIKDYIRVTSVLQPYSDFSNIMPSVLEKASERGTRVHKYCEMHANNLFIIDVEEDCKPYFDSFQRWFDTYVDKVIDTERRHFCDKLLITGQVDLVLRLKGEDRPLIVDIKTPQTPKKTWRLQTAAYAYLYNNFYNDIPRRSCLILDKEGKEAKFIEHSNYPKDLDLFLKALNLYKFFNMDSI